MNLPPSKVMIRASHPQVSAPDLALEERELGFVSFNANNVYEWNIDGKTEYNIMSMLQHMTMVGTAYQAAHETSEEAIANVIVYGFSGQLKGWWDNYLSDSQKHTIFSAIKVNDQNEPIIGEDGEPIPDAVNTLIFTIASHFIGDPSLWKDRSAELLSNLRCKTLSDF
ncbi:Polyprotein [Arachis hypogaea]|nr:Polyprotein [Arachis hypogaea]